MKTTSLDADEYFHLALHASSVGDHHACMSYLAEVLQQQPANARALYLRAVQHAELGLTERAVSGIKAALAIEPGLEIARLQLGLLLLDGIDGRKRSSICSRLVRSGDLSCARLPRRCSRLPTTTSRRHVKSSPFGLAQTSNNQPLAALVKRLLEHLSDGAEPAP